MTLRDGQVHQIGVRYPERLVTDSDMSVFGKSSKELSTFPVEMRSDSTKSIYRREGTRPWDLHGGRQSVATILALSSSKEI